MKRWPGMVLLAMLLAVSSCQSGASMSELDRLWGTLGKSADSADESRHAEAWVAYARQHSVRYEIELLNLQTGQPLPIAELTAESTGFAVRLRVKDRALTPDWQPKSAANVQKLLVE